jgi:hypothetical protein
MPVSAIGGGYKVEHSIGLHFKFAFYRLILKASRLKRTFESFAGKEDCIGSQSTFFNGYSKR